MAPKKKAEEAPEDPGAEGHQHNTRKKRQAPEPAEPTGSGSHPHGTRRSKQRQDAVEEAQQPDSSGAAGMPDQPPAAAPEMPPPTEEAPDLPATDPTQAPPQVAMEAPPAAPGPEAVSGPAPGPVGAPPPGGHLPHQLHENVQALLAQQNQLNMMEANAGAPYAQAAANHEAMQAAVAEMQAAAQQDALHVHALHAGAEGFYTHDVVQRSQLEGQRKADFQALAAAKRSGNLAIVSFTLELPAELADVELPEKNGIIEVPMTGDVPMLKRLFMYQAHNKLLPALQVLVTERDEIMVDHKDDGTPMPLAQYHIQNDSRLVLRVVIPESLDDVPLVDEALASAAYTNTGSSSRTPSRKTRWTNEQIEALVEGVEKYGLSAWRTIVMDPRLAGKNNMQCKDKFRNLCLTIIQGRPERGLTLHWQLKDRVRALIDQENIKGYAAQHAEQAGLVQNGLGGALPAGSGSQADGMMAGMGMHAAVAAGQQPGPPGMPLQMGPDGAQSAV